MFLELIEPKNDLNKLNWLFPNQFELNLIEIEFEKLLKTSKITKLSKCLRQVKIFTLYEKFVALSIELLRTLCDLFQENRVWIILNLKKPLKTEKKVFDVFDVFDVMRCKSKQKTSNPKVY